MKSLSKRAISLILAVLMIMDVFAPVVVLASADSPHNNVRVLDEVPESETNSQNNDILIPATQQTNPEEDTLVPAEVPAQNPSQNSSQKPAQKPVQNKSTPNQLYKSWTLVNPGKTTFAKGDILDLSKISVRVTKMDGKVVTFSYIDLLKDTNFDVIENIGSRTNLQPGKGSVTLVGPNLNPITINIVVNDSTDKLQGTNSNDELVPAIDPQAKEENDELVVAENPNDKKTNIIEGNEQNSPEKDKQTEENKLAEEVLKGNIFDQVLGKDTENLLGLKLNPLGAENLAGMDEVERIMAMLRAEIPTEQTQEEIDAGLIMIQPMNQTIQEEPISPVFLRSAFRSTGLFEAASFNVDQNQGLEISGEEISEPVGAGQGTELTEAEKKNLDGKKFTVMTRFETSNAAGAIQPYQYFDIHLDNKLKVNNLSELQPLYYQGRVIASPQYIANENKIRYNIQGTIPENIRLPLNIPVDYNTANIKLDSDGTFTVTNKVSGLGVKAPKDLVPQKVDKDGNLAGSIIEPGRGDVPELIEADDKSYKVDIGAYGIPVVENGVLKGFNWKAEVASTVNLNGIDFKVNFTTVKGSGLGEIQNLAMNGANVTAISNNLKNKLGIVDSVHYSPTQKDGKTITYTFYTPVTSVQETYMLDINAMASDKVGAKRVVGTQGYSKEKIAVLTPNRVGMNNRTSILGEFTSENAAKWTVTDQVSTGDDGKLPLVSRSLGGNQTLNTAKVAVYGIDTTKGSSTYGQMVVKSAETIINPAAIPGAETNPATAQPVGTIAAYEYTTDLPQQNTSAYTLGGVAISKYQDIRVDQNWGLDPGATIPAQTINAVDPNNPKNVLGTTTLKAETDTQKTTRQFSIPNVKVWNIDNGIATRIQPAIKQDLPKDLNGYQYTENYNYYKPDLNEYYIHNRGVKGETKKSGNFKLRLVEEDGKTPIPGATFRLFRGAEVVTDGKGEAEFKNISKGVYYLTEVQALAGYKLVEDTKIIVDDNGKVKATGPDSTQIGDDSATQYFKDDKYPLFMNLRSFAIKENDGKVTTYIYLKPDEGGGTNQDTRLNITGYYNANLNVEVYDVDPSRRPGLNQAMDIQSGVEKNIGGPALNQPNTYPIKGEYDVYESFTGKTGYQIKIPYKRFGTNWGFLVKVTGTPSSNDGKISYDWLVDNNAPGNNSKIQKTITPADPNVVNETTILVKNKKFETKPIEVIKVDSKKNPLGGATFVLKNSANGEVLKTVVSNAKADENGKGKGKVDFGKMPQGDYTIEEIAGPEGYIESQLVFDVHVDEASQVTYTPRFKDGVGTPVPGVDYWIEDEIVKDTETKVPVVTVDQSMKLSENNFGETGIKPGVWEAYRYESYTYKANIKLKSSEPGKRFEIQFDPNLDFTQYVNKFPEIKSNGQVIAKPYFNYDTNLLTYVFTEASGSGEVIFDLVIDGVIPSKFYAKNSGDYEFINIVAPGQDNVKGNQLDRVRVKAFYEDYDSHPNGNSPTQAYYFRDVYQGEDGKWYVKAIAYYNAKANLVGSTRMAARTLSFNWMSTNWSPTNIATWVGNGNMPAFELQNVKVYSVQPTVDKYGYKTNEPYMPLSMGVRPENDPRIYRLELNQNINGQYVYNRQGTIAITFDPNQIHSTGSIAGSRPLKIDMPAISKNNEGYVIDQTFKVTDLNKFRTMYRAFIMQNSSDKNSLKSAFASKVNVNEATAEQNKKEIPKFYKQKVMVSNEEYVPTSFRIRKYNEADSSKTLEGAIFTLTDPKTNKTISKTTSSDGYLTFDKLQPGVYRLEETKAPKDFIKSDKRWLVNVAKDGVVTITEVGFNTYGTSIIGKELVLDVANKPEGQDFVVYKKGDTGKPLEGATFTIKKKDGENYTEVGTGKSNTSGLVEFKKSTGENLKLTDGTYILEETEAPTGYKKLDKKWVLVVGKNKVEVHDYIEGPKEETNETANKSLLKENGTHWVNVAKRSPAKFNGLNDPRWRGYVDNSPVPYKMGTRIVGINTTGKYVIQRFVINPEAKQMGQSKVQIHKQPLWVNNMDWYSGTESYKIFELDKEVTENVEDIKLENYIAKELNVTATKAEKQGEVPKRMELNLPATDKPIIIDVKVPYKSESAGVGLGMDYWENVGTANEKVYWKPDFYESVKDIPVGDEVTSNTQAGNIVGAYISEGSLDVTNVKNKHRFEFTKVRETELDGLSGATFKLTGTKPVTETKWGKSDDEGKVSFEGLLPGTYKLEEHGAPQGYESSNTDWTVTIQDDGKIYIKDNNPTNTVENKDPEAQWQKVDVANSTMINKSDSVRDEYKQIADQKIKTHIVEINKATKRIRQVYVLNRLTEKLLDPTLELHSYPEKWDITTENTKVISVAEVEKSASPENLGKIGANVQYSTNIISKNNHTRLVISPKITGEKTIAVVIETDLKDQPEIGGIGTGMDYDNQGNKYWGAEQYTDINNFKLYPVANPTVDKNTKLIVDKATGEKPTPMARSAEEEGTSLSNTVALTANEDVSSVTSLSTALRSRFFRSVGGLEIGDKIVGTAVGAASTDAIDYSVESNNANITVSAGAVNTSDGTRDISVKITPKTKQTGVNKSHWVLLIDRSQDYSNKNNLDNNINKFLTDLRAKANTEGAEVYLSIIEYSGNAPKANKVLLSNTNIKDLDDARQYSYDMGTLEPTQFYGQYNLKEENVTVRDYLSRVGIDKRNGGIVDGGDRLKNVVAQNLSNLTSDSYDNKYVIDFANFEANQAKKPGLHSPSFEQYEALWSFKEKGYERVYTHVDQTTTELTDNGQKFRKYINDNSEYKVFDQTQKYTIRNKPNWQKASNFAPYVQKGLLDGILNDKKNFESQGAGESLLKNATVDIGLNDKVKLQLYKIIQNNQTVQSNPNPMSNSLNFNNISLGIGDSLEFKYRIGLDQDAQNNTDLPIHSTMTYKPDENSNPINLDNGMITRRNTQGYSITFDQMTNGNVTATKTSDIGEGESITLTAHPKQGYKLAKLYMDGNSVQALNNEFNFNMPANNVRVSAVFEATSQEPTTYDVTVYGYIYNGKVTPNKTKAKAGEEVTLTIEPKSGYELKTLYYNDEITGDNIPITDNKFTMPKSNVRINATFERKSQPQPQKYSITTSVREGKGTLTADPTSQEEGKPVTITVKPDEGYEIGQVTANGTNVARLLDQNGQYTFYMEAKNVSVIANFNKIEVVPAKSYAVGVDTNNNGKKVVVYTRTAPGKSEAGKLVEFTVTPFDDYVITDVWVQKSDGTGKLEGLTLNDSKTKGSFTMPNQAVTIYANAQYVQPPQGTYLVGINPNITGGSVTTDPRRPYPNTKVRIKATPNQGMSLDSLSVTKRNSGNVEVQYDNQGPYFMMPSEDVTVFAKFTEGQGPTPDPGGGQVEPDDNELGYLIYDPSNPKNIIKKEAKLTNRRAGLELKIFKKDVVGRTLEGGEFKLIKTEKDYKTPVKDFKALTAVSGLDGRILFKDKDNQPVKLQKGYYVLEEIKPPLGYKKASSKWKIEVKDDQGRMHATYYGPTTTPSQYLLSKKSKIQDDTTGTNLAIRTASKITHIDPDAKTFVQRVIIDLRGYNKNDKVNVQITPKYKRVEKDRPGVKPDTIEEGLKTAYRTTYKISNPAKTLDTDYILGYYDLSKPGVSMVNTARWRPFDWGFDEDQLNLDPGEVYFIDIEGYYDESLVSGMAVNEKDVNGNPVAPHKNTKIKKEDLTKLEMDIKFYEGARNFYQAVYNEETKQIEWNTFPKASYQAGAAELAKTKPEGWSNKPYNDRYQNWVGLDGGKIDPALDNATLIKTLSTSADISDLYTTDKPEDELDIPKEGLDIINDEETYNITFSKHGRDGEKSDGWESNGKKVTENRLEGAIFKLQQYIQNDYVDVPGSYVSSAFNGYFGFRGLKPGRYRLVEVEAPKGYRPIRDAILYMTVAYEEPKTNVETGDITPGRGKITLEYDNGNGIIEYNPAATNVEHGQLVDYVTSATAKNMGKIINEKPGQGKVRINKQDGDGKPLVGAKFRLIRLGTAADSDSDSASDQTKKIDGLYGATSENLIETATATVAKKDAVEPVVKNGKVLSLDPVRVGATKIFGETISNAMVTVTFPGNNKVEVKTPNSGKFTVDVPRDLVLKENDTITASIDEEGVAIFDKLPIGNYILEEIKSPDGYKSNGQKWRFTVGGEGLDPYVNDTSSGGVDLTDKFSLGEPEIRVQKTLDNDKTDTKNSVHPHKAQSIGITAKFTVPLNQEINPGDYFKVKLSDSIDLYGIYKDKPLGSLDIFADGVGTVAKAKYDKTTNTITYTFTEYARTYKLTELKTNLATWINLDKIKKSTKKVEVGIGLGDQVSKIKNYDVEYDIPSETSHHPYEITQSWNTWYGTQYETYSYWHNLTGKITEMDKATGEFTQYYYINRMKEDGYPNWTFRYNPYSSDNTNTKKLNYANVRIMKLNNNANIENSMPESFALDVNNDTNLTEILNQRFDRMGVTNFNFSKNKNSGSSSTDSYIVEVKGKIPLSEIKDFHSVGSIIVGGRTIVARWDLARFADNKAVASAQLIIQAINPKNEIKFRKTDYKGTSLAGAKFALYKKNGESWQEVEKSEQTTKEDGLVSYEKLAPGDYALFEKEAPPGYNKIEGHIEEFSVGQNGEITRSVDKNKPVGQAGSSNTGATEEKVSEPVGSEPIDVINYKNIEFIKIDSIDGSSLKGAEFKVLYKKEEKDKYKPIKVYEKSSSGDNIEKDMTVTSGEDGKFKLDKIYKDGYYALEEIKAPEGYSKMPGYIREFLLLKGKVLVKEKDPIQSSLSRGANGKITSQVLSVDKDKNTFTQRIIINPKHDTMTIPEANSFLRIIENRWEIPKETGKTGGKVKVAILKKDNAEGFKTKIEDLTTEDYHEYYAETYGKVGENIGSRYSLRKFLGKGIETGDISTTDTIVVEYTGKLKKESINKDNTSLPVEQKADVILGLEVIDEVNYTLDIGNLASKGPVYVDTDKYNLRPIEVENRKAEYPHTGGMGTFIFTCVGASLVGLAYLSYRRRRGLVFDE